MIGSINKKIEAMRFRDLDHRPAKVSAAVRIDDLIIIKFEDGTFYSSLGKPQSNYYTIRRWYWTDKLLKAMRVLKVITTEDIKEHMAACKKNDAFARREEARDSLERLAATNNFKISEEQRKILKFDERPQ